MRRPYRSTSLAHFAKVISRKGDACVAPTVRRHSRLEASGRSASDAGPRGESRVHKAVQFGAEALNRVQVKPHPGILWPNRRLNVPKTPVLDNEKEYEDHD